VLTVAVPAAVAAVEHLDEHVVTFGTYAQPQLLFLIGEVVERYDGGLAPVQTPRTTSSRSLGFGFWDLGFGISM